MAERKQKVAKRPKARRAAAASESGKRFDIDEYIDRGLRTRAHRAHGKPPQSEIDRVVAENMKNYRARFGRDEQIPPGAEHDWLRAAIARIRARQEAAGPQNPRMGGTKRKHGGY
jgi:hypothetical protein